MGDGQGENKKNLPLSNICFILGLFETVGSAIWFKQLIKSRPLSFEYVRLRSKLECLEI